MRRWTMGVPQELGRSCRLCPESRLQGGAAPKPPGPETVPGLQKRSLGRQAEDGEKPSQPRGAEHRGMVSISSASVGQAPASHPVPKATRSLRVLWDYWQLFGVVGLPNGGRAHVVEVAQLPQPRTEHDLDCIWPVAGELSAGPGQDRSLGVSSRSEPMIRGTVCSNVSTYGSVGALGGEPPRATLPGLILLCDSRAAG
jgi:hypothetical protein